MQHLITPSINTSLSAPGSWGSSRNSRCLLLLLTSASTAVKLDHYDANLRRCCNPWEEPGSVRPIEKEEESESEERGGRGWEKMMSAWGQQRGRQTEIPALWAPRWWNSRVRLRATTARARFGSAPHSEESIPWYLPSVERGYRKHSVSYPCRQVSVWVIQQHQITLLTCFLTYLF